MSTEFLMGTDGRKMSKSWGNAIWLDDSPQDMFTKIMAINDDLIIQYFTLATRVSNEEIEKYEQRLKSGENPIDIKKELARIIVSELYSKEEAQNAQEYFERTVQKKELPEDIPVFEMTANEHLVITDLLVRAGLVGSKSEAKRFVEQGAVEVDSDIVDSPTEEMIREVSLKPVETFQTVKATDVGRISRICHDEGVRIADIRQERAVEADMAQILSEFDITVIGPTRRAGILEWDKTYGRAIATLADIPQPNYEVFNDINYIKEVLLRDGDRVRFVKAAGLADGKGAMRTASNEEVIRVIEKLKREYPDATFE